MKNIKNFEQKILRLEEISVLLEKEDLGLEKAIQLYEEGLELSKACSEALNSAELKITILKKKLAEVASSEELFEE